MFYLFWKKKSKMLKMRIDGSFAVLRVGGQEQEAETLMAEYLILNLNTLRAPSLVCVLCFCWQYRVDSTSGIIAGPQCLSPPPGYALCTISCSPGRKRPATALCYCQSFMMHHLTQLAHVHQCGWMFSVYIWHLVLWKLGIKKPKLQNIFLPLATWKTPHPCPPNLCSRNAVGCWVQIDSFEKSHTYWHTCKITTDECKEHSVPEKSFNSDHTIIRRVRSHPHTSQHNKCSQFPKIDAFEGWQLLAPSGRHFGRATVTMKSQIYFIQFIMKTKYRYDKLYLVSHHESKYKKLAKIWKYYILGLLG